jgi:hypothetical protein
MTELKTDRTGQQSIFIQDVYAYRPQSLLREKGVERVANYPLFAFSFY